MQSRTNIPEVVITPAAWLSYGEAQIYTRLGRTTLWKLAYTPGSGIIAAKVGSAVRFQRESLDKYMRSCANIVEEYLD